MVSSLSRFCKWLPQYAKPIPICGKNVDIIYTPDAFYERLKHGVQAANKRVILSSLYLGTGTREAKLIDSFKSILSDSTRPDMKCTLLLDHLRGSRGNPNSRTMVQNLVAEFTDRFSLHLYHTPNLRGGLRKYGPERFNEVMGLQHMKIFIFDDDLMLSGANLSRDYFVDRQDRYIYFKNCPELSDFFADLLHITASHSFTLEPDGSTRKPRALSTDPLSSRHAAKDYRTSLGEAVSRLIQPNTEDASKSDCRFSLDCDTIVYPLVQMGSYGVCQDEIVTQKLLEELDVNERLYLASGYFNLPPKYCEAIIKGQGTYNILAASPQANGFYGAEGVAGHVPVMYIHFARKFLEAASKNKCEQRVKYLEYYRFGWTYHGKGLWYYLAGEEWPSLTLMGSSNYGHRSLTRDLEAQVAMVTTCKNLRKSLHEEQTRMFSYATPVSLEKARTDPSRKLTFLEWLATAILKPHV